MCKNAYMKQLTDLKAILHSKRANIYYLEKCRVMQKDGRVLYLTEEPKRRRGTAATLGSLPPSFAKRLVLSRSINACSASRNTTERSFTPSNSLAVCIKLSSMVKVLRIVRSFLIIRQHQIGPHFMRLLMSNLRHITIPFTPTPT
jgi:hypothetical protein